MSVETEWQMRCPKCGSDSQIDIEMKTWARLTVDGTDIEASHNGDHEWTPESPAVCMKCDYRGTVRDFDCAQN